MSTKKRTIAYLRVSTAKQADGAGPKQQQDAISTWALMTSTMIDEFLLDTESGDIEDRQEVLRLKRMAADGQLGTIVVDRLDRFARDALVSEVLYRFFKSHGVKVIAVSQAFDDSSTGTAFRQMMAVFAQLDKANRIAHLRDCRKATVAKRGTSAGFSKNPYGYRATGEGQLELVPGETKLVVRTFQLRDFGNNLSQIARILSTEGFRTRTGTKISPMQVSRILEREKQYRAEATFNHVELDDGVKPAQPAVLK